MFHKITKRRFLSSLTFNSSYKIWPYKAIYRATNIPYSIEEKVAIVLNLSSQNYLGWEAIPFLWTNGIRCKTWCILANGSCLSILCWCQFFLMHKLKKLPIGDVIFFTEAFNNFIPEGWELRSIGLSCLCICLEQISITMEQLTLLLYDNIIIKIPFRSQQSFMIYNNKKQNMYTWTA